MHAECQRQANFGWEKPGEGRAGYHGHGEANGIVSKGEADDGVNIFLLLPIRFFCLFCFCFQLAFHSLGLALLFEFAWLLFQAFCKGSFQNHSGDKAYGTGLNCSENHHSGKNIRIRVGTVFYCTACCFDARISVLL